MRATDTQWIWDPKVWAAREARQLEKAEEKRIEEADEKWLSEVERANDRPNKGQPSTYSRLLPQLPTFDENWEPDQQEKKS